MPKRGKIPGTKMPEAEVTLRLALWLLDRSGPESYAEVAIDGAHVKIRPHEQAGRRIEEQTVFDIRAFLQANGCTPKSLKDEWRGTYTRKDCNLTISSVNGFDVRGKLGEKNIRAECKAGPLQSIKGISVRAILARAIGQVVTSEFASSADDELWVAVPDTPAFESVGVKIVKGRLFAKTGIRLALVSEKGQVRLLN